ncbi:MAG: 23S rRNA (pseudouridine(1915)-N(3))-methyltransferase RlmH [Oscillospiraceae bacterium]|nr:23S rRNA (pseudouridine(1915)-N(3))-methyltransferase RlmH [Oscillospiraceae bacterium]
MFSLQLIATGKCKEKFYLDAAQEYAKRLRATCDFSILELPEQRLPDRPSEAEIAQGLEREAQELEKHLPRGAFVCVLTPEGKELSSPELAKLLADVKTSGKSTACFVIGSSFGMAERVKKAADFRLSMGRMTFPHHLARVMALEQLYRAEAIQAGSQYHK